jgi:hypothetical protein
MNPKHPPGQADDFGQHAVRAEWIKVKNPEAPRGD